MPNILKYIKKDLSNSFRLRPAESIPVRKEEFRAPSGFESFLAAVIIYGFYFAAVMLVIFGIVKLVKFFWYL